MRIYLIGMPLSGKSIIGKLLSIKLDYNFIDTDEELRKQNIDFNFNKKTEPTFRKLETAVYQSPILDNTVVATGGGVVTNEENFKNFDGFIVFLDASLPELNYRQIKYNHLVYKKNNIEKLYNTRRPLYLKYANFIVLTKGLNPLEITNIIYEKIKKNINN